jgi:carbon monoxide dehydrogenase subunit G
MLQFEGDTDFTQAPAIVWSKLSEIRFVAECIPDVESTAFKEPDMAVVTIRPGFSFVRGTLEVEIKLADRVESQWMRVLGHGKGIGSSNDVEIRFDLAPQGAGTRVHWKADVTNLGGLLKMMPKGLLQAAAQQVIGDIWATVRMKMGN